MKTIKLLRAGGRVEAALIALPIAFGSPPKRPTEGQSYLLCHCHTKRESCRIRRVKYGQIALAILAAWSVSLARADDFKTITGKEYKNATVSHVEPDGLVLKTKSGISKVYFAELPKEVQE